MNQEDKHINTHSHDYHNKDHKHHHHDHHHHPDASQMSSHKLLWVTLLNFSITLVQIIGGVISNSLSLLSDAIHNLGDSSALFIAFLAGKHSQKQADKAYTFGYKRIEILAALFNATVLIAICIYLFFEAYQRWVNPQPIKGFLMLVVATFGLLANLISVVILNKDKEHNLNVKAAYLHLMGDTLSSVAVILGGLAIWQWQVYWLDPVITVLVGIYIIHHTWSVLKQTVDILMQSTPAHIDLEKLKKEVEQIDEIDNIHHVHAWKLDDRKVYLEAHVNLKNNIDMKAMMHVKSNVENLLKVHFRINHITLQFGYECCQGAHHLIHSTHP